MGDYDDLTSLIEFNKDTIITLLKTRYEQDKIYTKIGNAVLLSINPWQTLKNQVQDLNIHLNQLAKTVLHQIKYENQSIICSGISGSGKTVSTKQLLKCIVPDSESMNHSQIIFQTNPILECFGNAGTSKNHNSSRFAKFIRLEYQNQIFIQSSIETYLLERSRIVQTPVHEHNFHIFSYLLHQQKEYTLKDFRYLKNTRITSVETLKSLEITGIEDHLQRIGFSRDDIVVIKNICWAILFLGNIEPEFSKNNNQVILSNQNQFLIQVAQLLQLDINILQKCLLTKTFHTKIDHIAIQLSANDFQIQRDSFAKMLYVNLFQCIVQQINTMLNKGQGYDRWIGLLDIFGFESFDINRYSQLLINLTNEKLQCFFNQTILIAKTKKEYQSQGIYWKPVNVIDNSETVELLESRPI